MLHRETHLPLLLGTAFAAALHLAVFTPMVYSRWEPGALGDRDAVDQTRLAGLPDPPREHDANAADPEVQTPPRDEREVDQPTPDEEPEPRHETPLGDDNPEHRLTVAWISWDDFRRLEAARSTTNQPAVQARVDPVDDAPVRVFDPTPPMPLPRPAPPRVSPAREQVEADPDPLSIISQLLPPAPDPAQAAEPAHAMQPARKQIEAKADADNRDNPAKQDAGEAEERRPAPPREQALAMGPENPLGLPNTQDAGETRADSDGVPVEQEAAAPPTPMGAVDTADGLRTADETAAISPDVTVDAMGPERSPAPPVDQEAALTLDPVIGDPKAQDESKGPDDPDGEPVTQDQADTPEPDDESKPAKAQPREGMVDGADRPRRDQAEAAPAPARPARPAAPAQQQQTRATSAPRGETDIAPTDPRREADVFRPGKVVVSRGIRITPALPRWSVLDVYTTAPKNVRVRLVFNEAGRVTEAKLLTSSGYTSTDAKILASLYRWTAGGEMYEDEPKPYIKEGTLLLHE